MARGLRLRPLAVPIAPRSGTSVMAATMNVKAKRLLMELKDKESTFAASLGSLEKMVKAAGGEERISFHDRMMIANVRAKLAAIRKAIAEAPNLE